MENEPVKVLLVDGEGVSDVIARHLAADRQGSGYRLDCVAGTEPALAALRRGEHDVCLIGRSGGGQSGLELIQQAQRTGLRTPLILLTDEEPPQASAAFQAGAADVLSRQRIDSDCLHCRIRSALGRRSVEARNRNLAAFASFNPDPVLEFATDGALSYFNEAARQLAETLGCGSPAALLPQEAPALIRECFATGQTKQQQAIVGSRVLSWSFFPIPGGCLVFSHATDLTERVALEEALRRTQKMDAVGQLAAGVAHDFNNTLTIIEGRASLLADSQIPDSPQMRALQEIRNVAERAGELVRQLLMFSRKQVLRPRAMDVNDEIGALAPVLCRALGEQIQLQIEPASNLPAIEADRAMLEQALVRLALHARQTMPLGGQFRLTTSLAQVTPEMVRSHPEARSGTFVLLRVSDTGCGLTPAAVDHIFEPFFRPSDSGHETGMGLATVYGMVKQHKGWIGVESQPGHGTTFTLYFPAGAEIPHPATETLPARAKSPAHGSQETILVAEDEPALRELVVEILRLSGYRVHSAGSGAEALDVWHQHQTEISLLVTDMVMPGMNGSELAECLHTEAPALRVIYTSGYSAGLDDKELTLVEGVNFLPKPYPPSKLVQLVRRCLDAPAPEAPRPSH